MVEREELRSKGRYNRQYPYVIGLFKICIITAYAHAVDTRPSLPPPLLEGLGTRLDSKVHQFTTRIILNILI